MAHSATESPSETRISGFSRDCGSDMSVITAGQRRLNDVYFLDSRDVHDLKSWENDLVVELIMDTDKIKL